MTGESGLEEKTRLLSSVDLLESLSWEEIEELGRRIPEVHFGRGQMVYTLSYEGEILFLLLRGRVRIYRMVRGQELTFVVMGGGEMFGEAALTAGRPRGTYAQAIETSKIVLMSLGTFGRLVRSKPEVGLKAMELLSERLSLYEERMADIAFKEVTGRLASLILQLLESEGVVTREGHRISTRYTHQQLGAMIGAKRVAVTRALGELRGAGAVKVKSRHIYVGDRKALERAAEGWT